MPWLEDDEDNIRRASYCEARGYLAHTLLRDADAMSMAHSLELRVPFLDHRLAEFGYRLPGVFKNHCKTGKRILRDIMGPILPAEITARAKIGFNLPIQVWLPHLLHTRSTPETSGLEFPNRNGKPVSKSSEALTAAKATQDFAIMILKQWMHAIKVSI